MKKMISLGLVAVVLIAALVIWIIARPSGQEPESAGPSSSSASSAPADPDESVCGLSAGDQTVPDEAPEAEWELVNGVAIPSSKEIGPAVTTDTDQRTCFAHNPTGALFAAARLWAFTGDPNFWQDTSQLQYSSEEAQKEQEEFAKGLTGNENEGISMQIQGFRFDDVSKDRVKVSIAAEMTQEGQTALFALPWLMVWDDGDWKISVPDVQPKMEEMSSLAELGYIPWSGVQ